MADPDSIATIHLNALYLTKQADYAQRTLTGSIPSSSGKVDANLQNACQEMESIFINYLFKEMRATINRSGFVSGGTAENIYTSMLDTEMSKGIAGQGGIGLSRILMDQLSGGSGKQDDHAR
jgi:flagellar protein FlgJ